jgi:phage gp29-like protein
MSNGIELISQATGSKPVPLQSAAGMMANRPKPVPKPDPPGQGEFALPHAMTFSGLININTQTYGVSDEALRHAPERAPMMRNDPVVMECVESRQRATALLKWHLETDEPKNEIHKWLCEQLTGMLNKIPYFLKYRWSLLDAIWYGRAAVSNTWDRLNIGGQEYNSIADWEPVNGDKLIFRYNRDNKRAGARRDIGVRVSPQLWQKDSDGTPYHYYGRELEKITDSGGTVLYTSQGMAYFLAQQERPLLSLHKHIVEDGVFEDVLSAGRINGVGIRDRIYWAWFQKQQSLATIMALIQRFGTGFTIATYPQGNEQAREEVIRAVREQRADNVLIVPVMAGEPDTYRIERIEPTNAGLQALNDMVHLFWGHQIKRYVLGQTATSETSSTGLNSNMAEVQLGTFMQIIQYDAINLQETMTREVVRWLVEYNFPQLRGIDVRFVIESEGDEADKIIERLEKAYNMGLKIPVPELLERLNLREPLPGEEVLVKQAPMSPFGDPVAMGDSAILLHAAR